MKQLQKAMQATFDKMLEGSTPNLFRTEATNNELWDKYLEIMPKDIFRDPNSSVYNCTRCQQFFNKFANIVKIEDNLSLTSIFDVELPEGSEYYYAMKELSKLVKSYPVANVFVETENSLSKQANGLEIVSLKNGQPHRHYCVLGIRQNTKQFSPEEIAKFGKVDDRIYVFSHFSLLFPRHLLLSNDFSIESYMSQFHSDFIVLKKGLDKISISTIDSVLEYIESGRIINSEQHVERLKALKASIAEYNLVETSLQNNLVWRWSRLSESRIAGITRLANELIGKTLIDLGEVEEGSKEYEYIIDTYNMRIDPVNYMKARSAVSTRLVQEAVEYLKTNNYEASLDRRSATINDINISEIMYVGKNSTELTHLPTKLDALTQSSKNTKPLKLDVASIPMMDIEQFFSEVMPTTKSLEVYLEPRLSKNMVNLITAKDPKSKPIFKWENNFSWTFNGNLNSTSAIKQKVKSRGGNIEGVLRVSLYFPLTTDDYDLHIGKPDGGKINFTSLRTLHKCSGMLDLDAQGKDGFQDAENRVENVVWTDLTKMPVGVYNVIVNNYSSRGLQKSFDVEIETPTEIVVLSLDVNNSLFSKSENTIKVATITLDNLGNFSIKACNFMLMSDSLKTNKVYSLDTFQFHQVNLVCLSPNYWGGIKHGIKHFMFMLKGAKTVEKLMMFHPEQLVEDLRPYRKVMELFSIKNMVDPEENQLAGVGFNETMPNNMIVKVNGKQLINLTIKTNSHVSI